jgi:membrane-associated protease RseP (regulator of RpoE activity)
MNKETKTIVLQIVLFIVTFITTTMAGASFCFNKSIYRPDQRFYLNPEYSWADFWLGAGFSVPFILILTVHEFGHYFTALYHKIKSSLPYYIPFPPLPFFFIGTMGAVIRIRSRITSNLQNFDIGLSGPLAGFIVSLGVLYYGFSTLPPPEYVFQFHPEYEQYGLNYADTVYTKSYTEAHVGALYLKIGNTLLFDFFAQHVADPARMPNANEIMHYPVLMAGFIALFFTALNLLPIGQLDGGHIIYGLFGRKGHETIATIFFVLLIFYAGLGAVNIHTDKEEVLFGSIPALFLWIPLAVWFNFFCFKGLGLSPRTTLMYALIVFALQFLITAVYPTVNGYRGWLLFGILVGRFIGIQHPPAEIEKPLDTKRIVLGWLMLVVFILCFSPQPLTIELIEGLRVEPEIIE